MPRTFSMLDGRFDKKHDDVATPAELYAALDAEFHFTHDPCPTNPPGMRVSDGLGWWGLRNFVNPPYSDKKPWIEKAIQEKLRGSLTVMLLPVDTSTSWFHDLLIPNCQIRFLKGRLKFTDRPAKFASMICIFDPNYRREGLDCPTDCKKSSNGQCSDPEEIFMRQYVLHSSPVCSHYEAPDG